jgi:hypothetical protein
MSEQIVAQSFALYKSGYKAKKETWDAIKSSNSQFEQVDLVPELLSMWDIRVERLTPDFLSTKEYRFETVQAILSDMSKASGWKQKTLLTMLKTNGRSRHTRDGTVYKFVQIEHASSVPDQSKPIEKKVFNYATKSYVSIKAIDHPTDHDVST